MKPLRTLVLISMCGAAIADSQPVKKSFDESWRAALQSVALEGFQILSSDKGAGLIQARGSFAGHAEWFRCTGGGGILHAQDLTLSIALSPVASGVRIDVRADGKQMWLRNHHVLWIKAGREWTPVNCESTGLLEQRLISRISEI